MDRLGSIAAGLCASSSQRRTRGKLAGASRFIMAWSLGAIALRLGAELYFFYSALKPSLPAAAASDALSSLAFLNSLPLAMGMLALSRDNSLELRLRLLPLKRLQKNAVLSLAMLIDALLPLLCGLILPLAAALPLAAFSARAFIRSALIVPCALVAAAAFVRSCSGLFRSALNLRRPRAARATKSLALVVGFLSFAFLSPRLALSGGEARALLAGGATFSLNALGLSGILCSEAALLALTTGFALAAFVVRSVGALFARSHAGMGARRKAPANGGFPQRAAGPFKGGLALLPVLSPKGELGRQLALISVACIAALAQRARPYPTLALAIALALREFFRAVSFLASDTASLRRILYLVPPRHCQALTLGAALVLAITKALPLLLCALLSALV